MRIVLCAVATLLAASCGSTQPGARHERYGISLQVPAGWHGEISRGVIRLRRGKVLVALHEYEPITPAEAIHFADPWPVQLHPADFGRRGDREEDDAYLCQASGRLFSVFAGSPAPSPRELDGLNEALADVRVEPGDHFPGTVEPITFAPRSGWHVENSRPAPRQAHGEFAMARAATVPFRDDPDESTPRRTVAVLPPDGIAVQTTLMRGRLWKENALLRAPPYQLSDLGRRDCPGAACEFPEYLLVAAYGERYRVEVRVYFGRERPTAAARAEADDVLRTLRFPDWGPWELDGA